jgi:hypothetical protein
LQDSEAGSTPVVQVAKLDNVQARRRLAVGYTCKHAYACMDMDDDHRNIVKDGSCCGRPACILVYNAAVNPTGRATRYVHIGSSGPHNYCTSNSKPIDDEAACIEPCRWSFSV